MVWTRLCPTGQTNQGEQDARDRCDLAVFIFLCIFYGHVCQKIIFHSLILQTDHLPGTDFTVSIDI